MYYLFQDGKVQGPFTIGDLSRMWKANKIEITAQVCILGTQSWMDISVIEDKLNPTPVIELVLGPPDPFKRK